MGVDREWEGPSGEDENGQVRVQARATAATAACSRAFGAKSTTPPACGGAPADSPEEAGDGAPVDFRKDLGRDLQARDEAGVCRQAF